MTSPAPFSSPRLTGLLILILLLGNVAHVAWAQSGAEPSTMAPSAPAHAGASSTPALSATDPAVATLPPHAPPTPCPERASGTVTVMIPYAPGSGPDQVAQMLARVWSERRLAPVQVCHMAEDRGRTALRWLASAPADGSWLMLSSSPLLPDDVLDASAASTALTSVVRVGQLPFVVMMPAGVVPARTTLPGPINGEEIMGALQAWSGDTSRWRTLLGADAFPQHPRWPRGVSIAPSSPAWNAILAPARLAPELSAQLAKELDQVLRDERVNLTLAAAGTELWPEEPSPDTTAAVSRPLPAR